MEVLSDVLQLRRRSCFFGVFQGNVIVGVSHLNQVTDHIISSQSFNIAAEDDMTWTVNDGGVAFEAPRNIALTTNNEK